MVSRRFAAMLHWQASRAGRAVGGSAFVTQLVTACRFVSALVRFRHHADSHGEVMLLLMRVVLASPSRPADRVHPAASNASGPPPS